MKLEKGGRVSQYKILSKIGKGGMGEVYLAEDTKLDRKVALKILPAEFAEDADRMNRFVREAKSASALNHPNIITIHEIGEFENTHYIATEFIDGKTLKDYTKSNPLNFKTALEIAIQVGSALDEAHSAGIVHRDIKPDNIMVRDNGLVKILDFGIAKLSEPSGGLNLGEQDATAIQQPSTTPGMIIGTANYLSPEHATGKEVDARTDIFSFGVVLYEMIAGHLPFVGDTPMEIIGAIIHKEPKPLDTNDVPAEIERIISKSLRKDRNERYQTIRGLSADLKEAKRELEFQDKLEKSVQPNENAPKTQMLRATTFDESNQTITAENTNDSITFNKAKFSKALVGGLAVLLISVIGLGYWYLSGSGYEKIDSIAVMPFTSTDGNKDSEFLSDGLAESIIYDLSKIPQLKVLPASTVFRYKGKETSPEAVAKEQGVRAVLVSRISQNGDDLTISTELIDTQQNKVIWGNRYARKVNDSLAIQKEISREISERLRLGLSGEQEKNLAKQETANPEAFQAYLKGRFYWNMRNEEGIKEGIEFFSKAIELDPNYALAWSGLADSHLVSVAYVSEVSVDEAFPKAKAAAKKAIELDPNLAEAHASLANVLENYDRNFQEAEKEYLKAIEIDPKYPTARHWYSRFLHFKLGRSEEALNEAKLAVELDPLSMVINGSLAAILIDMKKHEEALRVLREAQRLSSSGLFSHYLYTQSALASTKLGRYEEADADCRKIEKEDPVIAMVCMGRVYFEQGKYREAIIECEKSKETNIRNPGQRYEYRKCLGYSYAKLGNKQKVYEITTSDKFAYPMDKAAIYAILGDKDKAFEVLEKLLAEKVYRLSMIQNSDDFDNLKSDPRYDNLLKGIEAMKANKN